jgi:xanthine dehydrogenase small subunit
VIEFILNNQKIVTKEAHGISLLDLIRNEQHLFGTKIGCREGDCGACTVLEGSISNDKLTYQTIISCLTPLINVHGKHIVTVEGLNMKELSPVQTAMCDHAATQCGFCTPGFVVSLTGHVMSDKEKTPIDSISGNVCRCTGYKSIEKAAHVIDNLKKTIGNENIIEILVNTGWLPLYFNTIQDKLSEIKPFKNQQVAGEIFIGGGTDLMVQQAEKLKYADLNSAVNNTKKDVEVKDGKMRIGAGISMTDFFSSPIIQKTFPRISEFSILIASEQIRNMATLAGNIVNASPIGDLSILLLVLEAELILAKKDNNKRAIPLKDFFLDYKKIDLQKGEVVQYIVLNVPEEGFKINFEKVSKRTHLDIASVNSAISVLVQKSIIQDIHFSLGGISAVPKVMLKTSNFLIGKEINVNTLAETLTVLQDELSPISDIRGSIEYKRLLARQLFLQHFMKIFGNLLNEEDLFNMMTTNALPHEEY